MAWKLTGQLGWSLQNSRNKSKHVSTRWKGRTDFTKLSSDLLIHVILHVLLHTCIRIR